MGCRSSLAVSAVSSFVPVFINDLRCLKLPRYNSEL